MQMMERPESFDRIFRQAIKSVLDAPDLGHFELSVYCAFWSHLNPTKDRKKAAEAGRVRIDTVHPGLRRISSSLKMSLGKVSSIVSYAVEVGDFVIIKDSFKGVRHFAFRHFVYYYWPEVFVPEDMSDEKIERWQGRRDILQESIFQPVHQVNISNSYYE